MFFKISVLKNFEIFSGKHLCWSAFFNKVTDLKYVTLLKKRFQHRFFPVNIAKFLRAAFYLKHLWWLVLKITSVMKWIKPLNASVALIKKPVNWFTSSCPKTCTSYPIWKVTKLCFSGAYCVFENSVCVWCVCVCVCGCVCGWVGVGGCVCVGGCSHAFPFNVKASSVWNGWKCQRTDKWCCVEDFTISAKSFYRYF